jgi:hypothetical protein
VVEETVVAEETDAVVEETVVAAETVAVVEETDAVVEETDVAEEKDKGLVPEAQQGEMVVRTRAALKAAVVGSSRKENKARIQDIITVKETLETHSMMTESRGDGHGQ